MGRSKNDRLTTMSIVSFEVCGVEGDWKEVTGRWHEVSRQCQGVANLFWDAWNAWHYDRNSYSKMKDWLRLRETSGVSAAGKCPVDLMPAELSTAIYNEATKRFPDMASKLVSMVIGRVRETMTSRKAVKGSLPGATAILLHNERSPSWTKPIPIPFDRDNTSTTFCQPRDRGGNWHLTWKFWRQVKNGESAILEDRAELWCKGKKVQSQLRILERIAAGEQALQETLDAIERRYRHQLKTHPKGSREYKQLNDAKLAEKRDARSAIKSEHYVFAGSQLVYSKSRRKWFAQICYEMPAKRRLGLEPSKIAVLSAEETHPFLLQLPDGSTRRPGGDGRQVAPVRSSVLQQRWDRNANYRYAGSASKGHGRNRATQGQDKLKLRWKDFTKSVNRIVANHVVGWCIEQGVGTLIYEQPAEDFAKTRFLANAGKVEVFNRRTGEMEVRSDSTGWDWFGLKTELERACKSRRENGVVFNPGISLETRKRSECEVSCDAKSTGTARKAASVDEVDGCTNGRAKTARQNGRNNKADGNRSKRNSQTAQ